MLKNLKLSHKLIGSFAVMAMLVAVTGSFGIRSINKVSTQLTSLMQSRANQARLVLLLEAAQKTCRASLMEACLVREDKEDFNKSVATFQENRDLFRRYSNALLKGDKTLGILAADKDSIMEEHAKAVLESWGAFEIIAGQLVARKTELLKMVTPGKIDQFARNAVTDDRLNNLALNELTYASDTVKRDIDDLSETVDTLMKQVGAESRRIQKSAGITFVVVIFSAAILAFVFGLFATRYISKRVKLMVKALQQGADGNLTVQVDMQSADELGKLGEDFNAMVARLAGMVTKVNRSVVELGGITASIYDSSRRVVSSAEVQGEGVGQTSSAMTQINASIRSVAHGVDGLSLSASETSSSMLQMAASIEEVAMNIDSLSNLVEEVSSSIVEMGASVKQIERSACILMEATVSTASSVAEMDTTIRQVEKNALESAAISEEVRRDAETGRVAVDATILGIKEIRESSRITYEVIETLSGRAGDIGSILSVIDEVAEQTNLLALNAAIIAAQAGDQGKGFAVVADEIKELADRTSMSTREIAILIKGVQDETARAVEAIAIADRRISDGESLSEKSGLALKKIVTGVEMATEQVESIARATTEQAKGSRMIREAMERVSDMIGQIASATGEQSKGSDMIMSAAERMKTLTSQVRYSAMEQSKTANFVAGSTEDITGMITQIKRACDEQERGSEQIVHAIEDIQVSTRVNQEAAVVLNGAVANLSRHMEILKAEMGSFKV